MPFSTWSHRGRNFTPLWLNKSLVNNSLTDYTRTEDVIPTNPEDVIRDLNVSHQVPFSFQFYVNVRSHNRHAPSGYSWPQDTPGSLKPGPLLSDTHKWTLPPGPSLLKGMRTLSTYIYLTKTQPFSCPSQTLKSVWRIKEKLTIYTYSCRGWRIQITLLIYCIGSHQNRTTSVRCVR